MIWDIPLQNNEKLLELILKKNNIHHVIVILFIKINRQKSFKSEPQL